MALLPVPSWADPARLAQASFDAIASPSHAAKPAQLTLPDTVILACARCAFSSYRAYKLFCAAALPLPKPCPPLDCACLFVLSLRQDL